MKGKTKNLTQQVQEALLTLPDDILMKTIVQWLDDADEHVQYLDWTDEYRYQVGYRIQSDDTEKIYASFDELNEAEPDDPCASWIVPEVGEVRNILSNLSVEQFYHIVIPLAGDALSHKAFEEQWGYPPSSISDGYDFMRSLAVHLRYKGLQKSEKGHLLLSQGRVGRRRRMNPLDLFVSFWTR